MASLTDGNDDFSTKSVFDDYEPTWDPDDYDDEEDEEGLSYEELMSSHTSSRVPIQQEKQSSPIGRYIGFALIGVCALLILGLVIFFVLPIIFGGASGEAASEEAPEVQEQGEPNYSSATWQDLDDKSLYVVLADASGDPFLAITQEVGVYGNQVSLSVTDVQDINESGQQSDDSSSMYSDTVQKAAREEFEDLTLTGEISNPTSGETVELDATELFSIAATSYGVDASADAGFGWLDSSYQVLEATPTEVGLRLTFDMDSVLALLQDAPEDVLAANQGVQALQSAATLADTMLYLEASEAAKSPQTYASNAEVEAAETEQANTEAYEEDMAGSASGSGFILTALTPVINATPGEETVAEFVLEATDPKATVFPLSLSDLQHQFNFDSVISTFSQTAEVISGNAEIQKNVSGSIDILSMEPGSQITWTWTLTLGSDETPQTKQFNIEVEGGSGESAAGRETVISLPVELVIG